MAGPGWIAVLAAGLCALSACSKSPASDASKTPDTAVASGSYAPPQLNKGPPKNGEVAMEVAPTAVVGSLVEVRWTGPGNDGDYVDIVLRGHTETSGEKSYAYVRDTGPTGLILRAPTVAGDYDVRYILQMPTERIVKAVSPLLIEEANVQIQAPETATGGEEMKIVWSGPNGEGDYIDIVPAGSNAISGEITYASTHSGSPAVLRAPGASGAYDVRYVLEGPGGRKVAARSTINITTPKGAVTAPASVKPGEPIQIKWTGPAYYGDYVDLVPKGYDETSGELSYFYVKMGAVGELTAPTVPGEYEVRYILDAPGGRIVLARAPVAVKR